MDILDKYKNIISMFEDMGLGGGSTADMAPYSTGAVSVTTVTNAPRKDKSKKAMLQYKYTKQWGENTDNIVETMLEIAKICEATAQVAGKPFILHGKPATADDWRNFMRERKLTALKMAEEGKEDKEISEGKRINPEISIPQGNIKRVKNNINRYNNQALDIDPNAKYAQKEAVAAFVRAMKAKVGSGNKKLSPEDLELVQNIRRFAPANMNPELSKKVQNASNQIETYKGYIRAAKEKENQDKH